MTLQFIRDTRGNTTGVFIPIEEWQTLKARYNDLQIEEASTVMEPAHWQKTIIDERLNDYYIHPDEVADFDKTIDEIENNL